ncbi:pectinesterase family protein [Sphingobacterium sp. LRF_L2]|uniref:pectinesterase family protein n=1 Tax=Sphingobacterium sp. LRF_L2 TaxID=3369421 RepID=UPI003F5F9495
MKKINLFVFLLLIISSHLKAAEYDIVVAKDGTGDFVSIQAAIDAVPAFRKKVTTIFVKKGIYKEKVILAEPKQNIRIVGEDKYTTILTYDDYAQKKNTFGEDLGTSGSSSFYCTGEGFRAENISFQNSSGPVGQAVAIWVAADKAVFINCRFLGFQDTLYTYGKGARQLYLNCYIEGTVDYIFGSSTAWFEQCELHCKGSGFITAASTPESSRFGYVFNRCQITGDEDVKKFYLGRPWRPYAKVIVMNSSLPYFIADEGWNNWGKASNEETVSFSEFNNVGEGALSQSRVKWMKILSKEDVESVSVSSVFGDWAIDLLADDSLKFR